MKDIDIIKGATISSFKLDDPKTLYLFTDKGVYTVLVDDDGCGGNDSYAWIDSVSLGGVLKGKITEAYHEGKDSYGTKLVIKVWDKEGYIEIKHEHNGYYGFSYEVDFKEKNETI